MKRAILVIGFVVAVSPVLEAQNCTSRMLLGIYAGLYKGWGVPGPGMPLAPFTLLDRITFDHTGAFTASATMSMGGMILDYTAEGTMTVNPDCTTDASYIYRIGDSPPMGPEYSKCVVRDAGARMECLPLFGVIQGSLAKIRPGSSCSTSTMRGTYAVSCTEGWLSTSDPDVPLAPASVLATLTYESQGAYYGQGTRMSAGGMIVEGEYEGAVEVNPDCSLSAEHVFHNDTLDVDEAETAVGLVAIPGQEFYTISTVPGKVLSCVLRRVNRPGF
jgi:hypothetical protein